MLYKQENIILAGQIMSQTRETNLSKMTKKEHIAHKAFKDFQEQYLAIGGKPSEISNIIQGIMNKTYLPVSSIAIEEALAAEALTEQLPGE